MNGGAAGNGASDAAEPTHRARVAAADAGARFDVVLAALAGMTRAAAQRLIARELALVNGAPARKQHLLRTGDELTWRPLPPADGPAAEEIPLAIVYRDDWLLVVDKPAGLVVHPGPGHEHGTLVQGLVAKGAHGGDELRPGIVHRLDKDTSGLLIVARREEAYQALVAALARHEIRRTYVALLSGRLLQDEGAIDAPIGRHPRNRTRMSLHTAAGKRAVTHFRVLGRADGYTLVRVSLETGRTHQIRVHFAALGHPVAGDVQYGRPPRPDGLTRQFLHAAQLSFAHPQDGREIACASPLPDELASFLGGLGLPPQPLT